MPLDLVDVIARESWSDDLLEAVHGVDRRVLDKVRDALLAKYPGCVVEDRVHDPDADPMEIPHYLKRRRE